MPRSRPPLRLLSILSATALLAGMLAAPVNVAAAPSKVQLVVTFRPGTSNAAADAAAARGGPVTDEIKQLRVRVVTVPAVAADHVMEALRHNPSVQSVERDGLVAATWVPPDPLWGYQWEQRQVRAPRAWGLERGTYHTLVAVVDTGVQLNHPDLVARLVDGHDFVNHDPWAGDDNGHGTSVAGIIAATANSIGIAGMCGKCKILPVKALDRNGIGQWTTAAKAIVWAANHHADVINLSFGGPTGGSVLGDAIAYARSKGAVVVAAAGNFGSTARFYPAAFPGVISVAATDPMDLQYPWSDYSTTWVNLAAPGCTWATKRGSNYGSFCGTSAATPVVSGIAALMDSARPGITRTQIESILKGSAIRTPWAFTRTGRVDAYRAVYRAIHGSWPSTGQLLPKAPLLDPADDVTLAAGNHAGYRFDTTGAMMRGLGVSLEADTAAHATKRTTIPGRSGYWLYLVDGGLSGYWVQESSSVYLTPDPTPTPSPSPTPTPTPSPTPTP